MPHPRLDLGSDDEATRVENTSLEISSSPRLTVSPCKDQLSGLSGEDVDDDEDMEDPGEDDGAMDDNNEVRY